MSKNKNTRKGAKAMVMKPQFRPKVVKDKTKYTRKGRPRR